MLQVDDKQERLSWERKIVSTLAKAGEIKPSDNWLGNYSTKEKIKKTGLWLVNELNKDVLTDDEFDELKSKFLGEVILFDFGFEGGGGKVYLLSDKTIVEKGSSGGILDEDEDPHRNWEKPFETWEEWWQNFTNEHKDFWIHAYPIYIHDSIKSFILNAIDNYNYSNIDADRKKEIWKRRLG